MLRSGRRKGDTPFVAKICSIWQETGIDKLIGIMYQLSPIYACVLGTFLGGIMMSVFWYYRKEDTDKANSLQFVNVCIHAHQVHNLFISCPLLILLLQMEIMASQHHDDISVACIDDKCIVLGLTEFCRYNVHLNEWF